MNLESMTTKDSEDLEALFDSIVAKKNLGKPVAAAKPPLQSQDAVIERIGRLTRALHDNLLQLGRENGAKTSMPYIANSYDRLSYIATAAEQSPERTLKAAEKAHPVAEQLEIESKKLAQDWDRLFTGELNVEQFRNLAGQTRTFLAGLSSQAKTTDNCLTEIMMAQGGQALAGRTIRQAASAIQHMEKQLLEILIANPPEKADPMAYAELLERRVQGHDGAVETMDYVDELLASFGF